MEAVSPQEETDRENLRITCSALGEVEGVIKMFSKVISCAVLGVNGILIGVEADVNDGLPMFTMVGYLSSSVKEAGERVRTALRNSGYRIPPKHITINLSPANLRKDGAGFDLPVAIAVLLSAGLSPEMDMNKTVVIGELGLNGTVKAVQGVLPMVCHCHDLGITDCIVPRDNMAEAAIIDGMRIYGVSTLREAVELIQGNDMTRADWRKLQAEPDMSGGDSNRESGLSLEQGEPGELCKSCKPDEPEVDFSDIRGQEMLKRGMEIAAAGFHNVLLSGEAGAGKSMLARCLPTIMPEMSFEERLEVTKIYSVSGLLAGNNSLIMRRPFRAPHHTISNRALIGGGAIPKPGEVSLAHNGVLFLDELPEFNRNVLEVLRQPLEDRQIVISRVHASHVFPADFMLVAAMNPCPCGNYPNMNRCTCSPLQLRRYQSKISGPLLDRIDIRMEVKAVRYHDLFSGGAGETSACVRARVEQARLMQRERYAAEEIHFNSQLDGKQLQKYIRLGEAERREMEQVFCSMNLSARGAHRILKLARTIADLAGSREIRIMHLREAVFYRNGEVSRDGM